VGAKVVDEVTPAHLALVRRLVFDSIGAERAGDAAAAMDEIGRAARD
jgi:hypothetical protein